ncbi:hypothetical protein TEQG_01416 [Trichophyton equinum CBS 127.97]|uniref:Uncharacterized protein n=1 Tax=Trichophyton equinum (strain ATCC MYA-4606 / CBS 127.97) TaxID=559882 RepID=F2PKG1_TRIEC|nr:hypothetical protein TEQG_01416 [Trichophyton equinum CBS 127.97]
MAPMALCLVIVFALASYDFCLAWKFEHGAIPGKGDSAYIAEIVSASTVAALSLPSDADTHMVLCDKTSRRAFQLSQARLSLLCQPSDHCHGITNDYTVDVKCHIVDDAMRLLPQLDN